MVTILPCMKTVTIHLDDELHGKLSEWKGDCAWHLVLIAGGKAIQTGMCKEDIFKVLENEIRGNQK